MAKHMDIDEQGPKCPKCGSREFRTKSVLEWGSARQACAGCGTGLLPATRATVKAAKKLK